MWHLAQSKEPFDGNPNTAPPPQKKSKLDRLKARYSQHIEQRRRVEDQSFALSERNYHWMMTLISGSLLLSLTLIEKVVPSPDENSIRYLVWAWIALPGALGLTLASSLVGARLVDAKISRLDKKWKYFRKNLEEMPSEPSSPVLTFFAHLFRWGSAIFFGLGISLLSYFGILNIPDKAKPSEPKKLEIQLPESVDSYFQILTQNMQSSDDRDDKRKRLDESKGSWIPPKDEDPLPDEEPDDQEE